MAKGLDFGLEGRSALVCGSSAGIGYACAEALARCGASIILNARNAAKLEKAAEVISAATGAAVDFVAADVSSPQGRAALLTRCPSPDILVNNSAGPPTGDFREFDEAAWEKALAGNMIAPIMMIRAVLDGMIERKWGRIINITSSAVKAPLPLLGLSNGARSGLTGFIAGLAREVAADGVTINNLLPGRIQTDRLQSYVEKLAAKQGISADDAALNLAQKNPMRRFGAPEEVGAFCAFLASKQAAYVTGQNFLVDGGEYPGL